MPDKLCINCIEALNVSFKFKKQSQIAEHHLRNLERQLEEENVDADQYIPINDDNVVENPIDIIEDPLNLKNDDDTSSPSEDDTDHFNEVDMVYRNSSKTKTSSNGLHFCLKCKKDFLSKSNLMRHMRSHDGSKPYQCSVCGLGFTQNGSLNQHMLIHSGTYPFECKFCAKKFRRNASLISHLRRHTKNAPYVCEKCSLRFLNKTTLQVHFSNI